jgi:hypothetical protein
MFLQCHIISSITALDIQHAQVDNLLKNKDRLLGGCGLLREIIVWLRHQIYREKISIPVEFLLHN